MAIDKKNLSILLVGGSGEGKSEFILSFINDEHRKKIPASGDGQTTRTSTIKIMDLFILSLHANQQVIGMTLHSNKIITFLYPNIPKEKLLYLQLLTNTTVFS